MYIMTVVRLLVIPLLTFTILKLLGFHGLLLTIPVVLAAMPAAANTAIVAQRYENDYKLASQMIFMTTLAVMVTIPFILKIIG